MNTHRTTTSSPLFVATCFQIVQLPVKVPRSRRVAARVGWRVPQTIQTDPSATRLRRPSRPQAAWTTSQAPQPAAASPASPRPREWRPPRCRRQLRQCILRRWGRVYLRGPARSQWRGRRWKRAGATTQTVRGLRSSGKSSGRRRRWKPPRLHCSSAQTCCIRRRALGLLICRPAAHRGATDSGPPSLRELAAGCPLPR